MLTTNYVLLIIGPLWCVNSTGELFCYCIKTQNFVPVELPSITGICCLQPKYQSLWLLSVDGTIYVRRGITPSCQQGIWWQVLDLLQLGKKSQYNFFFNANE